MDLYAIFYTCYTQVIQFLEVCCVGGGGGGGGGWRIIFLEDICDIVFGLFDTKTKQLAWFQL